MTGQQPSTWRTGQQGAESGTWRTAILILATVTTGLTAGTFVHWSNTIMPGLGNVDDRTFVLAYRALDAAILNPLFLGMGYLGAMVFTGVSIFQHRRTGQRPVLILVGVALALYLLVSVVTFGVHEPLNEAIRAADVDASGADFAAIRAQLDEAAWATWNTVRALASTIAFGCVTWALAIHRQPGSRQHT